MRVEDAVCGVGEGMADGGEGVVVAAEVRDGGGFGEAIALVDLCTGVGFGLFCDSGVEGCCAGDHHCEGGKVGFRGGQQSG